MLSSYPSQVGMVMVNGKSMCSHTRVLVPVHKLVISLLPLLPLKARIYTYMQIQVLAKF